MKSFQLLLPKTIEEAVGALPHSAERGARERVKLLAGGQDLLGELKDYLVSPDELVDLRGVPGLAAIEGNSDGSTGLDSLHHPPGPVLRPARCGPGASRVASTGPATESSAHSWTSTWHRSARSTGRSLRMRGAC